MQHGWSRRLAGVAPASLIAACLATPPAGDEPASMAAPPQPTAAHAPIDWSQGDCLSRLRQLQEAAREGRLGPDERPPFAVQLVAAPGDWLEAVPSLPIEADLPIPIDDAGVAALCVLRIGPARDQRAAHRAVDVEDVRSVYQSGLRSERNPDYDAAQLAHREAKDDAKGSHDVVRVGDPLLDLVGTTVGGLIGAFDRRSRTQEVEDAAAMLAATPRSRDRPVYRPYGFERVVVRAQKQAVVPVALLDARGRELRATELRQRERRELFVLRGLDPRDRDYEQHRSSSMTRADLARWERTPPVLRLSSVALALTDGDPAAELPLADIAPAAGPPALAPKSDGFDLELWPEDRAAEAWLGDMAPGAPGTAAPAASVVAVRAGGAAGHGFYVRDDLVLTTYRLVGATSVVDITTADGATVPALVAAVDAAGDLALLQVPRPGPALELHDRTPPATVRPSAPDDAGLPVLWRDQVVGMSTGAVGAGGAGMVPSVAIRAFLDHQADLLAALP